jgi:hypothetical protein
MDWVTIWAKFSQIHLVTLLESEEGRGIVNTFNVLDSVGKLTSKLLQFWIRQHCALLTQKKHTIDYYILTIDYYIY